jgi:dolichol-phosphate mannosyltransferase
VEHPLVTRVPLRFALPVYNEGDAARRAVERLAAAADTLGAPYRIWVYDDGSTDGLGGLDRLAPRIPALTIHRRPTNGGVGEFFRWCLGEPIADGEETDILAILEGDATSDLDVLPALIEAVRQGADVAVASRYVAGGRISGFPAAKQLTSWLTNGVMRALYRSGVHDWTMFYRVYRVGALRRLVESLPRGLATGGFTANTELLVGLTRLGCRIVEIPQHYRYGEKTGTSKLRVLPHVRELARLVVAHPPGT